MSDPTSIESRLNGAKKQLEIARSEADSEQLLEHISGALADTEAALELASSK